EKMHHHQAERRDRRAGRFADEIEPGDARLMQAVGESLRQEQADENPATEVLLPRFARTGVAEFVVAFGAMVDEQHDAAAGADSLASAVTLTALRTHHRHVANPPRASAGRNSRIARR